VKQQMREDQHVVMTLAIADSPADLQVIGVNGRDRLNAPFCFDVDLISPDPALNCASLLHRSALLTMGSAPDDAHEVHGEVYTLRRLYRGVDMSLYRLRLAPSVQRLEGRIRRRTHNGLSAPQIIVRLLHDHGLGEDAFRFQQLTGLYPAREHCVQYDESDLHLLHRLCEEEGISYRFEHHHNRHVLVFSDDPAAFPESPSAVHVDHLAEHFSIRNSYSSHAGEHYAPPSSTPAPVDSHADNQRWSLSRSDGMAGRHRQLSERQLQRYRCERRDIMGASRQPSLRSGQIARVEGHPDTALNDQWLLTEVQHSGKQLAPLRHCSSRNVIEVLQAIATANQTPSTLVRPPARLDKPVLASYANRFQVIPWTMPFRPSLQHHKPNVTDVSLAVQTDDLADTQGRVRIRYDWQAQHPANGGDDSWARVVGTVSEHRSGTRLHVRFFEGDPDQPVICGAFADAPLATRLTRTLQVDGIALEAVEPLLQLHTDERLQIDSHAPMMLHTGRATLSITESGIHYTPLVPPDAPDDARSGDVARGDVALDLQLLHPANAQQPLASCTWYIVRMPRPDLAHLARIGAEDILFEGKTDAEGWLGLRPAQYMRLLQLYRHDKATLCLVHPGHCRTLHSVFQQRPATAIVPGPA
jgi:type VI secretion system secreted protein VgrG